MLRLSLKKGDAVHIVLPDGTNAIIEALARCELGTERSPHNFPKA